MTLITYRDRGGAARARRRAASPGPRLAGGARRRRARSSCSRASRGSGRPRWPGCSPTGSDVGDVLWGVCDPLGVPRPLGPLHDVADDLGEPARRPAGAPGRRRTRSTARSSTRSPPARVLLVVDDLQWADEATIDLLRFLLRRIAGTRSLVLATYRADEPDPQPALRALLGDVARTPSATRVELDPLSVGGGDDAGGGAPHRPRPPAPAHARELLLRHRGRQPGRPRSTARCPSRSATRCSPATAGLDAGARDLADLLACAPGAVPDTLLPALGVGIGPLRTLDAAGLIARDRRGITYRHDICRLAVAGAIPPGGEVDLHRRMLEALETLPDPDPAVLAHHALAAGDAGRVFRYAARAGSRRGRVRSAHRGRAVLHHGPGARPAGGRRRAGRAVRAARPGALPHGSPRGGDRRVRPGHRLLGGGRRPRRRRRRAPVAGGVRVVQRQPPERRGARGPGRRDPRRPARSPAPAARPSWAARS